MKRGRKIYKKKNQSIERVQQQNYLGIIKNKMNNTSHEIRSSITIICTNEERSLQEGLKH